jgi:hypothetical protein
MKRRRRPNTATLERLQEHRELEYLRAAYAAGKRFKNNRFPSQKKRKRARDRLQERDEKLNQIGK